MFGAGQSMQSIDVLCDEPKAFSLLFESNERLVCRIGVLGRDQFTPPIVPFPDEFRVSGKGIR